MDKLLAFLNRLDRAKIHHTLRRIRPDTIMVFVDIPGERWEIEFFVDGHVEVEIFRSDGEILDESELGRLFEELSG